MENFQWGESRSGEFDRCFLGNLSATSVRQVSVAGALFAPKIEVQIAKTVKTRRLNKNVRRC